MSAQSAFVNVPVRGSMIQPGLSLRSISGRGSIVPLLQQEHSSRNCGIRSSVSGGLRMSFGRVGESLVTYGDVFRQVDVESQVKKVADLSESASSESEKIPAIASITMEENQEGPKESFLPKKKHGVVSAISSGVVAALNRVLAGPDSEEVKRNLEVFAAAHPGIKLAFTPRPTKRISDIDRLEKCFEQALDVDDIEDHVN